MTSTARRSGLDPDGLEALEEERDHLLRSIDDLEREYAAGDVDETDYLTLRDDYTARAAAVIRAIEERRASEPVPPTPRRWGRTLAWTAGVIVFAVLCGVLVARMSGSRRDSESATGDVRDSSRTLIADAFTAFTQNDLDEAIELFGEALDIEPSNVEALAYRGWAQLRAGRADAAMADLDRAIELNDQYPDARVFRAIAHLEAGRFQQARDDLAVLDTLDPPQLVRDILAQNKVRERVVIGVLLADDAPTLAESGFSTDDVLAAAQYVTTSANPEPATAVRLYDIVLAAEPDNADAHAEKGWTLARVGVGNDDAVVALALQEIDAALAINPQHPGALVYRAFTVLNAHGDAAAAKAALDRFDSLAEKPDELVELIDQYGLRDAINEKLSG
ncbi:MAG TPA: tetratricopeptide repeat protein [Acidimicrobiales bacterium]